jgi:hypothetical protein
MVVGVVAFCELARSNFLTLRGSPGLPIEAPRRHMRLKRGLEGRHQLLKFVEGHTGEIQELRRAGLQIGERYMGHKWRLLA